MTTTAPPDITTATAKIDLLDGQFYSGAGVREDYRRMRERGPVFRDRNGLAAVVTHPAVLEVLRRPEQFSSAAGHRPEVPAMPFLIDMDGSEHLIRRRLVGAGFIRHRLTDRADAIDRLCDDLVDSVIETGACDFVDDLAAALPMAVIGDMLGVPAADHRKLLTWSDALMEGMGAVADGAADRQVAAFAEFNAVQ